MSTGHGTANPFASLVRRSVRTVGLVRVLAPRDLKVRYRQSVLDIVWALISPVLVLIVYGLVLAQFGVTDVCGPYLSFAWTGLVLWTFFATAIGSAVTSLVSASDIVTKIYFPREALPLASAMSALADLGIGLLLLVIVFLAQGVRPALTMVVAPLPLLVLLIWTAAASIWVGVIAAFVRDVIHLVNLFLRVGFFATPVMYSTEFLPRQFAWTATANPLAVAITGLRESLLCQTWPDMGLQGAHVVIGLVVLAAGVVYTASVESRIADVV